MKNKSSIWLITLCVFWSQVTLGQNCMGLFPQKEKAEFEMTFYNKKGKESLITLYKVNTLEKTATGYSWEVSADMKDEKGKLFSQVIYYATCKNGEVAIDMMSMMNPASLQSFENLDMEITGDKLLFPPGMKVGQTLPDARMDITAQNGPIKINGHFSMENRKVEAKEEITTPAGTYECLVISGDQSYKMVLGGHYQVKQWIAPKIGMVKFEYYSKNGKLMGYNQLTQLKM